MGFYAAESLPYCGAPPNPADLWGRWNLDPALIAALVVLLGLYLVGAAREQAWRRRCFFAGWSIGVLALVGPLCALSVSLFSARVAQHMILILSAAPLVSLGRPMAATLQALRLPTPRPIDRSLPAAIGFTIALWFWHAPYPYAATFLSTPVYWTMHLTLIGAAIWLWSEILNSRASFARAGAATLSMIQMGFLGALITLAERAAYAPHALTTAAWSLTPLEDQQLGGAIMWAPGTALFLAVGAAMAWRLLQPRVKALSGVQASELIP